jgi:hypothetical protein
MCEPQNGDGSVARMSNADRLRCGHGLPMSDNLVDIGLVEQHAPSTSSQPSLAHRGQWIRSDTIRDTKQGATLRDLKIVHPTTLAPPTLKSQRVPTSVLRSNESNHRLQNPPPRGRRATPRPLEHPDVHVRRQHPANPCLIKHGRVPPTHATHSKPNYKPPDLQTILRIPRGQYIRDL